MYHPRRIPTITVNIDKANYPVALFIIEALKNIISTRVPSKVIKTKIKDKPWFNDLCLQACREKQSAYRLWTQNKSDLCWDNYKLVQAHANLVYEML